MLTIVPMISHVMTQKIEKKKKNIIMWDKSMIFFSIFSEGIKSRYDFSSR